MSNDSPELSGVFCMRDEKKYFYGKDFDFGDIVEYRLGVNDPLKFGAIKTYSKSHATGVAVSFLVFHDKWGSIRIYSKSIIRVIKKEENPEYFV